MTALVKSGLQRRYQAIKSRVAGPALQLPAAVVSGSLVLNPLMSSGAVYAPYIPLIMTNIMKICVECQRPGAESVTIQGKSAVRDMWLCRPCQLRLGLSDYIFRAPYETLFPQENMREDSGDGIIWSINQGVNVWLIYSDFDVVSQQHLCQIPKKPVTLTRPFYCHDSLLYKDTADCIINYAGGYGLARGPELYLYHIHKIRNDGQGWVVGFLLDGKHLIAHDVEMDDESE